MDIKQFLLKGCDAIGSKRKNKKEKRKKKKGKGCDLWILWCNEGQLYISIRSHNVEKVYIYHTRLKKVSYKLYDNFKFINSDYSM